MQNRKVSCSMMQTQQPSWLLRTRMGWSATISRALEPLSEKLFPKTRREVLYQPELQTFPLFPSIEWHLLGGSFDPNCNIDSPDCWQTLTDTLTEPLDLSNT